MAFSAVIEPLRAANTLSAKGLYERIIVGLDESAVVASNGIRKVGRPLVIDMVESQAHGFLHGAHTLVLHMQRSQE